MFILYRKHRSHKSGKESSHRDKDRRDDDRHKDRHHQRDHGSGRHKKMSKEDMEIQEANELRAKLGMAPLRP